jgi:thiol-disulfide isomerase/thioredoxin
LALAKQAVFYFNTNVMHRFLLCSFFVGFFYATNAQQNNAAAAFEVVDTIPAYLKTNTLIPFKLLVDVGNKKDSVWFSNNNIPPNVSVLVMYFSPECGHCKTEMEELIKHIDSLAYTQIIFASYYPLKDIKKFYQYYQLHRYKNIVMGRDVRYTLPTFFKVKFTPFSALYNNNGKFIKAYEMGLNMQEAIGLLNQP